MNSAAEYYLRGGMKALDKMMKKVLSCLSEHEKIKGGSQQD